MNFEDRYEHHFMPQPTLEQLFGGRRIDHYGGDGFAVGLYDRRPAALECMKREEAEWEEVPPSIMLFARGDNRMRGACYGSD